MASVRMSALGHLQTSCHALYEFVMRSEATSARRHSRISIYEYMP